jgi:transposase
LSARVRNTGSCAARPHAGGRSRSLAPYATWLRAEVARQPDVTLDELCERAYQAHGVSASPSMMCRELQRLRLPRKKSRSTIANGRLPE